MEDLNKNQLRDALAAVAANIVVENGVVVNSDEAAKSFVEALSGQQFYMDDADWLEKEFGFAGSAFITKCERLLRDSDDEDASASLAYFLSCAASNISREPIRKLMNLADSVNSHMPIEEKLEIAKTLEEGMKNLAAKGNLSLGRDERLKPEDIVNLVAGVSIWFECDGSMTSGGFERIIETIIAIKKEDSILSAAGNLDREALEADRLKYGAKGANLIVLKNLLEKLRGAKVDYRFDDIEIPEFNLIGVELYKKWLRGKDIIDELREFYTGGALIIRSSAVYSEDGNEITGAGVYQSLALEEDSTFEDFVNAVTEVYESCNSEGAVEYRKANEVDEELMGLVIQKRVEYPNLGYVNSTRPGTDDLSFVGFEGSGKPPLIVYSSKIDALLFSTNFSHFHNLAAAAYIQPDIHNFMDGTADIENALFVSRVLEKYYGQPVQIEFAGVYDRGAPTYLLQCRPLPAKMFNHPNVEFPSDKPHFYECQSEGSCDLELDLLKEHEMNEDRDGMVVFGSSHFASMRTGEILRSFPKNGVVIVLNRSELGHGHIETLAMEKGLTILFGTDFNEESILATTKMRAVAASGSDKKFRVVSDGRKARVYEV